ncbi:MAG: cysteine desulfurase, partial [Pseudomonadota bacterium]|nr:cysteine desulfurase [Pseudomonadota bacterium]
HGSEKNAWWCWVIAIIGITAAAWLSSISLADSEKTVRAKVATTTVSLDSQVMEIVSTRCSMCHASKPLWEGLVAAPKGIVLDTQERVKAQAKQIYISSYLSNAMPPSNVSYMENSERKLIALWFASIESTKQASLK